MVIGLMRNTKAVITACTECKRVFGSESAFPEEPFAFTLDDGEYVAEQSGDDTDIFIIKSPYFTWCQFCSPCAAGAGYLENYMEEGQGVRAYCFGHDWFDAKPTGNWIDCKYCHGSGLRQKSEIHNYNESVFVASGGKIFDDNRVCCWVCGDNLQYGLQGKVKEPGGGQPGAGLRRGKCHGARRYPLDDLLDNSI